VSPRAAILMVRLNCRELLYRVPWQTHRSGTKIPVNAGGDLQAALNSAHCGDTIELQAGATFPGTFVFPAKSCDSGHWVIVRTSAPRQRFAARGQRLTPCYAGVTSLPDVRHTPAVIRRT